MSKSLDFCQVKKVPVDGHEVVSYSYGSGNNAILFLNGGPGLPLYGMQKGSSLEHARRNPQRCIGTWQGSCL